MGGEWGCRCVVRCGALEGRVWVTCVCACVHMHMCFFFFLGVCDVHVFTIHMCEISCNASCVTQCHWRCVTNNLTLNTPDCVFDYR